MKQKNMNRSPEFTQNPQKELIVTEGKWGDVPWQFVATEQQPPSELCTAAFCILIDGDKLILVEHSSRGYEFTGGHIDHDEDIAQTVSREVSEESKAIIDAPTFFGYKKVSPAEPIPLRDDPSRFYPFPHSYVPYYFARVIRFSDDVELAQDVKAVRSATYDEACKLLEPGHNHDKILSYLLDMGLISLQ
jgi:8-oxo-dGTP pyrophosphatase MutT (NUDIX family)